ncbi:electron transfer flavoprotein subunit alpha/FixB family protein [Azohydromonas caseinilytica]|uniref:Electron transfer flavoprotein subunit alpha/FixB family protein n=1 Tax=Azohydromonas caseinilytica TaxID=2728836 RepID=A0A848FDE6_9BURK|nr:electron transfer flavoprotein subunit alpha/FixB family protein [Azohydromonas caseinilytica]NML18227.1 electron transfer flavoprotein subunit alpha/FixB family protein [Azohydromonas caseinilytica]
MIRRLDPRRPALITPQGLRRIVLGSTEGERDLRGGAVHGSAVRRARLHQAVPGCVLVIAHPDCGSFDEHAREAIAAAALLAQADEAVVVIAPATDAALQLDAAALGIDRLELLPITPATTAPALATAVARRWQALRPRLVIAPERGDDADIGRRLAVLQGLNVAASVVEVADGRVRVRDHGGVGRAPGDATTALQGVDLLLIGRQVARTELPFLGLGQSVRLEAVASRTPAGVVDLGRTAGQAQQVALEEADFILAAGNGVTDVALFHELAQALGAAVGASRVAVDDGRFPRSQQIGATGRTVQARGYLALGISGAVQHLQGIRECRHVMAVNTDPAAPMVQRAELTVAEDVQPLMRALLTLLRGGPAAAPAAKAGAATKTLEMA